MMRTVIGALVMTIALSAQGGDAPPPEAPETASESKDAQPETTGQPAESPTAEQAPPARPPSTGSLQETVRETMRTFTPSEAIDVDKPVDFPANI